MSIYEHNPDLFYRLKNMIKKVRILYQSIVYLCSKKGLYNIIRKRIKNKGELK